MELHELREVLATTPAGASVDPDAVGDAIRSALPNNHQLAFRHCGLLTSQLILEHVLDGGQLEPCLPVVQRIAESMRGSGARSTDPDNWRLAVELAASSPMRSSMTPKEAYCREFAVADAARQLREAGYAIEATLGRVEIEHAEHERISSELLRLVEELGGINVIAGLLQWMQATYDASMGRYLCGPRVATVPDGANPFPPIGYLLQLAAAHPSTGNGQATDENWGRLIKLATNYAAAFNVQRYGAFEAMFKTHNDIVEFLQELALHDSLFRIRQIRPRDAVTIATGLLRELDGPNTDSTLCGVVCVGDAVLKDADGRHAPVVAGLDAARAHCKVDDDGTWGEIVQLLCHDPPGANPDFLTPFGHPALANFMFKPLLESLDGEKWLFGASPCAEALVEAVLSGIRQRFPRTVNDIGFALERVVRQTLQREGVACSWGKYQVNGETWECDVVVETPRCVYFLEAKNKSLTRPARAGDVAKILVDLATSVLHALLQAGQHEVHLRQAGQIRLEDAEAGPTVVELRGRDVQRVAISLFDFGSLQDQTLLRQFLTGCLRVAGYTSSAPEEADRLENITEHLNRLRSQTACLMELRRAGLDASRTPPALLQLLVSESAAANGAS